MSGPVIALTRRQASALLFVLSVVCDDLTNIEDEEDKASLIGLMEVLQTWENLQAAGA